MSDETQGSVTPQEGQAQGAPSQEVNTQVNTQQTQSEQAQRTQTEAEESFYADFNSLAPEVQEQLKPYYKQMQGAFTKKAQQLAKQRQEHSQKVQAYDQFVSNPVENILRMAGQYGLQLSPGGQAQQQTKQQAVTPDWTPNTWEDVFGKSADFLKPQFQQMLEEAINPYKQEISALKQELGIQKANRIEKQFDAIDPNWRQYEDDMRELLEEHPSLAKDPVKLYKLAVPDEVFKARATQEAFKSLEAKTQAAKIETSGRSKPSGPAKQGPMSFQEAFEMAKQQLGRR